MILIFAFRFGAIEFSVIRARIENCLSIKLSSGKISSTKAENFKSFSREISPNTFLMKDLFDREQKGGSASRIMKTVGTSIASNIGGIASTLILGEEDDSYHESKTSNQNNNVAAYDYYANLYQSQVLTTSLQTPVMQLSKPQWVVDAATSSCVKCQRSFSALTKHKHHCRQCGKIYCRHCSARKRVMPNIGFPYPVRLCDPCHDAAQPHCRLCHVIVDTPENKSVLCGLCKTAVCSECSVLTHLPGGTGSKKESKESAGAPTGEGVVVCDECYGKPRKDGNCIIA